MSSYYEKMLATGEVKCIDEEIPFDVPQGWEWERWGNIAQTIQYGYNAPALEHGVIKMVRISDIQENCVLWDNVPYCLIDENDIDTYLLKVNDILFARTGGTVGKSFLVEEVPEKAIYAGYLIRTRYSSLLNPRYMKSFMESQLYWEQLKNGTIATAQPNCNGKTLAKMLLPIPPTKEQDRIVKKLTQLSSFLDNYGLCQDRLNLLNEEIKEQLKKSILQEAIQGKLVPQLAEEGTAQDLLEQIKMEKLNLVKEGKLKKSALATSVIFRGDDNKYWEKSGDSIVCIDEEIPFGIPSSWSWCRLGNIASVKGGKRIPVGEKLTTENTGHMYIRVADMKENTVKTDDIHYISESIYQKIKSYTISTEDLYITVAGTIGSVGEIPKVFDNANLTENADKIVFRGICKKFLMHCLLSNFVQSQIKKCTTKVGQPKLAIVRIEDLLIPLPPIKEQYRIVHKIEQTASIMS
ncbi:MULTISPECIES: restriction endonuclease subunit S [Bacteroidaceae]|uniref:Restriction endonuclease subunit S n=3 Tax=Bacteroidales TaxID=171549 RepID=A0AAW4V3T5_PHOVU|nr:MULTISPECIES: restriction endonuclease subunit S [Bacteroidaceae]MBV4404439.1 restriction endonuclease subunit S [Phocaeicola vulgatus]MCB6273945.1 restriction endonuclease subunit S [Phocaeicola vulgatus]MCB6290798.1 restriction endonuclease subunit S [Phocaeicola vulgatus]MCB6324447.1 restriction endonuclease subunit S [Phocaeicola vulgatus]MCB6448146.1 restriction endonuclease subunit S [Phocaeicola vulgatus]